MNYLRNGGEDRSKIEMLLSLTSIKSEGIQAGIIDYFCRGFGEADAAGLNDVRQPNLKKQLNRMQEVAGTVERIKELDLSKVKSIN